MLLLGHVFCHLQLWYLSLSCRRGCALRLSLHPIFLELCVYFPTMLCCVCRDTFPCPLLFISLILAVSLCSFSVSLPTINNYFCQQFVIVLFLSYVKHCQSRQSSAADLCSQEAVFYCPFVFIFILFNQIFIFRVFIYYPMDAQFIYSVLVEDGCFLESLVPYSLFICFDSVKNSSGLER